MKRIFLIVIFFSFTAPCFAQLVLTASNTGVVNAPIDQNGWQSFKITLTQNIMFNFVVIPPAPLPAQATLRVIFVQDATGGRTVTFASNILNPCGVISTSNSVSVCQFIFDGSMNTWQGIGGGNFKGVGGSNPEQTVSPLDFGGVFDVQFVYDCSWTTGTSQVTCGNGDMPCVNADAGKIMFGVSSTAFVNLNAVNSTITVPQGIISTASPCASANVYNISTTTTATCPNAGIGLVNCNFAKGTQDDSTAINNTALAAWNTFGSCKALHLPSKYFFFGSAIFNGATLNNSCGAASGANGNAPDLTATGPEVFGEGPSNSVGIPLPTFNFASCTGGSGSTCVGGVPNGQFHDFGINGLQQQISVAHSSVNLFQLFGSNAGGLCAGGTTAFNLSLSGWGFESVSNDVGFDWGRQSCNDATIYNINVILFGHYNECVINEGGNVLNAYGLFCFGGAPILNNSNSILTINGAATGVFNSYGGMYFCPTANGNFTVTQLGGTWNSFGDVLNQTVSGNCNTSTNGLFLNANGATTNFNGSQLILGSGTPGNSTLMQQNNVSGNNVHFHDTVLTGTGTNNQLFLTGANDKIFDEGGNTFTNGTRANSISGAWIGTTNSATGTICVTGNFALTSGWGTSTIASVASNGNIQGCHVNITGAAGAAGPVLTWTYPIAPIVAPGSCHLSGVSGTLTGATTGTPGTTSVAFTFTGTPSAQSYSFDVGCP